MTGFHKRKVQRRKQAEKEAAEKERQGRIQRRKEVPPLLTSTHRTPLRGQVTDLIPARAPIHQLREAEALAAGGDLLMSKAKHQQGPGTSRHAHDTAAHARN